MNTFENTTPTQEVTNNEENTETKVADAMREIDTLSAEAEKNLDAVTDFLDTQEAPLDNEKVGVLRSIGEKFKKSRVLKATALAVTLMSAQSAFAQGGSIRIRDFNSSHQLNVDASDFNNPAQIKLRNIGQLRAPGLQPGQLSINGQNIPPGQISHFNRDTLPNATINGGPAHEIAPGIYGDENTIYRQTPGGGTVLVVGISVE